MDSLASAYFWFGVAAGFCGGVIFLAGLALFASVDTTVMERRPTPYFTADYEPIAADEFDEEIVEFKTNGLRDTVAHQRQIDAYLVGLKK